MKEFILKLIRGIDKKDIPREYLPLVDDLLRHKIIKVDGKIYTISSKYRVGKIDIARNGTGFLEVLGIKAKDLLIEPQDLNGATKGDLVVAKRIFKGGGRPKAKVVYILEKAFRFSVAYYDKENNIFFNVKNEMPLSVKASKKSLKNLPDGTVVKIDNDAAFIVEVLGVLDDPFVDEKISLALYNKKEEFSKEAELEASAYGNVVDKSLYPNRVDLTHLPFCTIDPVTAKDHDDAIYFDQNSNTLYVAIADVSEYVSAMGPIDKEAKERGFSIYLPHKSIPMLPRSLSEGICSLKENEERLAFVSKITLNKSYEPIKEELFDAIIKSRRKYSYDRVDEFIEGKRIGVDSTDEEILAWLMPLFKVTKELRKKRLQKGFEFTNPEIRLVLDENQELVETVIETETPSHALIEDCMLLANKATAKMFDYGIFRTHEEPSMEKIEELLNDLAQVGIFTKEYNTIHELFLHIQKEAEKLGIKEHVDRLLIRTQKQAGYTAENIGHFGLGFEKYTHFTSPIRRYSDLTLHRLLKALIQENTKQLDFILRNIEPLTVRISELEREAAKVEWDFMDRKFARWAKRNLGKRFRAIVTDPESTPIAQIDDEIKGARIFLPKAQVELFDTIIVEIIDVNIATTKIYAKVVEVLDV
ncbi:MULTISPECIES: ribonuclease R family protein [unclassified Nitratiruptor]|uniref:VacB/RNase II family 3'-5' exoribonuclease n=1 Tax=unclassified Nitratiruptor TaxID=2624044 RepID=UPI0019157396|nr:MULTISPECIES: ribonuclease R family protein [unclassified Nitratiruptor]BCD60116.1 ribonuclease R [Nitratiruptor sp. YY08-10]BCD64395.1 ribonuclease R [Nitratiruptor sp. YY08-14]